MLHKSLSDAPLPVQFELVSSTLAQVTLAYATGAAMAAICIANLVAVAKTAPAQPGSARWFVV